MTLILNFVLMFWRDLIVTTFRAKKVKYSLPPICLCTCLFSSSLSFFERKFNILRRVRKKQKFSQVFLFTRGKTLLWSPSVSTHLPFVTRRCNRKKRKSPRWGISAIGFACKADTPQDDDQRDSPAAGWRWAKLWLVAPKLGRTVE